MTGHHGQDMRGPTTMNIRKIITLATAGTAAASLSIFGLGLTPAYADPTSPSPSRSQPACW